MSNKLTLNQVSPKKIITPLESEEWYQALIEECQAIITESVFTSRWTLIEGYHMLGKRIPEENANFRKAKVYGKKITQRVATSLNKSQRTIEQAIQFAKKYPELDELPEGKNISWHKICNYYLPQPKNSNPIWLRYTDVWNFASCDKKFGTEDFPGKIPGQIIQNVLYYWTKENDLVIDPMAGGGTTVDVCHDMNRKCIAFDTRPVRKDIIQHDATKKWPINEKADLVFIDPPYWSQQEEAYGGISRLSYKDYLTEMELIFEQTSKFLKEKNILTVLIAPMAIKTQYKDIPFDFTIILLEKFGLIRRIAVPVSSQQVGPQVMGACKRKKELVAVNRDLLIFRKKPKAN